MRRNDLLKVIAMLTMVIDHIGAIFYPRGVFYPDNDFLLLRIIGRIAFPIFAYMISVGYSKTRSKKKYAIRLAIFGLISYIPYVYFGPKLEPNFLHFNVMILFLYSLGVLYLYDLFMKKKNPLLFLVLIISIILPQVLEVNFEDFMFSYSTYGILMVLLFYRFKTFKGVFFSFLILTALNITVFTPISWFTLEEVFNYYPRVLEIVLEYTVQYYSIIAIFIIYLLKDVESKVRLNKYIGYAFYPGHMALILLIKFPDKITDAITNLF